MITIVLDPGHGGPSQPAKTGGSSWNNATGPGGMLEKTVTLKVAKAAAAAMAGLPVRVVLTRSSDVNLGLVERAGVAKKNAAEVFVSIHFNAPDPKGAAAQGTETWIDPSPRPQSRKLAQAVQAAMSAATGYKDRGLKNDSPLAVVKNSNHHPKTAHCLVEISFLSRQPAEEARLKTDAYIQKLGEALRDGIVAYCTQAGLLQTESASWNDDSDEHGDAIEARRKGYSGEEAFEHEEQFCCEGSGEGDAEAFEEAAAQRPTIDRVVTTTQKQSRNGTTIDHIVVHYTTSRNIEGTIATFTHGTPGKRTSAHYIIDRDGTLVSVVDDEDAAWHSGSKAMNLRSIGIEHVAAEGDRITDKQGRTSIALIGWLMAEYGVELDHVIPHVCVHSTSCCGDLFKDYGGGANFSCTKQKAALHKWLAANGIGETVGNEAFSPAGGGRWRREASFFEASTPDKRLAMAQAIVNFEARRDNQGRVKVYNLPPGDGGGAFEVAGINERYDHDEAWALRRLVEAGRQEEAEARACEYVAKYTDRVAQWTTNDAVEFYLRDSMFNRGPGGAAHILQRALGVHDDGRVGPDTLSALHDAEANPRSLLKELRAARESYERQVIGMRPQFAAGLINRWNNALTQAQKFLT